MKAFIRERIYYEIAMSIGNSLDMDTMLKECLSTYLRKLNCLAGAVLLRRDEVDNRHHFEPIYAIPKRTNRTSSIRRAFERTPHGIDDRQLQEFMASLPQEITSDDHVQYTMALADVGLLILVKNAPGLSGPDIKSLLPLNDKLANACRSCLANEQMHKEILEREIAEEKYRSIFENSLGGIFQSSTEGRFVEVNPAMARALGYDSPDELIAHCSDIATQMYVDPKERRRLLERLNKKGQVSNFEAQFYRKDGSIGWGSVSCRYILDKYGTPTRLEGHFADITPRMKAMVYLRKAKEEAVRLSNMKSSFLSMVSHELRTPLTSILGFAKLAQKQIAQLVVENPDLCPDAMKVLDRIASNSGVIVTEGERLTELINNVLDLAKLESDACPWEMKDIVFDEVLEHAIRTARILFDGTPVTLHLEIESPLPHIQGDHNRLIQVMLNLLSNAKKFTESGSVRITARRQGDFLITRVQDTGMGIHPNNISAIFDKFSQSGNTLTDKPQGTGLGLPICKEIIENHGGELWVESELDKGSTFAFSLPVKE